MPAASATPAPDRWIDRPDRPALPPPLERAVLFFETLSPQRLADVPSIYAPEARFLDPFNDLRGQQAIAGWAGRGREETRPFIGPARSFLARRACERA